MDIRRSNPRRVRSRVRASLVPFVAPASRRSRASAPTLPRDSPLRPCVRCMARSWGRIRGDRSMAERSAAVGQGMAGFGKRAASNLGEFYIQEGVTEGLAAAMNRPLDYTPMQVRHYRRSRIWAIQGAVIDEMPNGQRVIAVPRIVGAYIGSFAQAAWRPAAAEQPRDDGARERHDVARHRRVDQHVLRVQAPPRQDRRRWRATPSSTVVTLTGRLRSCVRGGSDDASGIQTSSPRLGSVLE